MTTTGGPVVGIDHLGIDVADLEADIEFYGRLFGLLEEQRTTLPEPNLTRVLLRGGGRGQGLRY